MAPTIQLINPVGLYDPSPNGYTHVAIAPPGAVTDLSLATLLA